ncbi:MAG: hypothetical protein JSR44_12445, partial [Spirochaetes bacterium]|nr:hypothetical protein [Spirochaetota bacterium]
MVRNFYFRQSVFAALAALCVLFALEPYKIWPLGFVAVFFILRAAEEQRPVGVYRILGAASLFALASSVLTFGWIFATIHRYTGGNFILTVFLGCLYALLFNLKFHALFLLYRYWLKKFHELTHILAFAAIMALTDALAPELFPWSWGNTLAADAPLRQLAALGSVYLIAFAVGVGGAALHLLLRKRHGARWSYFLKPALPALAILTILYIVGAALYFYPIIDSKEVVRVLAIQTNIGAAPEAKRSDEAFATDAINRLFNQSAEALLLHEKADIIFWPEAAMPFHSADRHMQNRKIYSQTFDGVLEYFARALGRTVIFQDMVYRENRLHSRLSVRPSPHTSDETFYLKRRLVPWGEYLPLENIFPALRRYFFEAGHFSAGKLNAPLDVSYRSKLPSRIDSGSLRSDMQLFSSPEKIRTMFASRERTKSLRVQPTLCYEALYPSDARTQDTDLIVNLASDAWFGDGIEGHQHLGAASLRAVENGVPMVRSAMSGVSAVFDARGDDIVPRTGQARQETLYAEIPLEKRRTLFARFGMAAFYILMGAALWPFLMS